jgi:hypothetical protein
MTVVLVMFSVLVSLLALRSILNNNKHADPFYVLLFLSFVPGINVFVLIIHWLMKEKGEEG